MSVALREHGLKSEISGFGRFTIRSTSNPKNFEKFGL